jgi:phosphoglycolate phosphatase-like HAD superfamily hydrolase
VKIEKMNLMMFDVDGTLVRSNEYDAECYVNAVSTTLGISVVDTVWENYEHVSDSGVIDELVRRNYDRAPTEKEFRQVKASFLMELDRAFDRKPHLARPIDGAITFLASVRSKPDLVVSIATGGWEKSCRKKLMHSGVSVDGIPLASADDALSRVDIMKASLRKAEKVYQQSNFNSVIYVGDATWDLKAFRELGWHFIAVGESILSYLDDRPQFWVKDFTDDQVMSDILEKIRGMA